MILAKRQGEGVTGGCVVCIPSILCHQVEAPDLRKGENVLVTKLNWVLLYVFFFSVR